MLGFFLVQVEPSSKTSDLLDSPNWTSGVKGRVNTPPEKLSSNGCASLESEAEPGLVDTQPSGDETEAVSHVCLVQRVRVSSRCSKLVKVKVAEPREGSL